MSAMHEDPAHWIRKAVEKRLREELAKLQVEVNEEKSRTVDLQQGESLGFLGFEFRRIRTQQDGCRCICRELRSGRHCSQAQADFSLSAHGGDDRTNQPHFVWQGELFCCGSLEPVLFVYPKLGGDEVRRHLAETCQRRAFGWKRWSKEWLYGPLGLFHEYRMVYQSPSGAAAPIRSTS